MFYVIEKPPQWMLDGLLEEDKATSTRPCPDCGAAVGEDHVDGCDVARCQKMGGQRLSCDCGDCGNDAWTGLWPGIKECYEHKLVCFDTATKSVCFDLNTNAVRHQIELHKKAKLLRNKS
jgi:hypothetical protein